MVRMVPTSLLSPDLISSSENIGCQLASPSKSFTASQTFQIEALMSTDSCEFKRLCALAGTLAMHKRYSALTRIFLMATPPPLTCIRYLAIFHAELPWARKY